MKRDSIVEEVGNSGIPACLPGRGKRLPTHPPPDSRRPGACGEVRRCDSHPR